MEYHVPVMLAECIEGLNIRPNGVYVDVTFGGGGHSREIVEKLGEGKLIAFDQDKDAEKNAEAIGSEKLVFVAANFRFIKKYIKFHGFKEVDGILADLGISSHQIDEGERGFSTRLDGKLDMRMDHEGNLSAFDVVNDYEEEELSRILWMYGEVKKARSVAQSICHARMNGAIETTQELKAIINKFAPKGREFKFQAQVFQAIRIEVNDELGALKEMLEGCKDILKVGGRLVVMSYHSLEDRLVKNYMRMGKFSGEVDKDMYGNLLRPFKPVQTKPIVASQEEIEQNRRARSAKLRVAERI